MAGKMGTSGKLLGQRNPKSSVIEKRSAGNVRVSRRAVLVENNWTIEEPKRYRIVSTVDPCSRVPVYQVNLTPIRRM